MGGGGGAKPPGVCVGGVYGMPLSAATAAARPFPSAASTGGGVFSRCWIGSGAAGAAGLYGKGALCSCVGGGENGGVCWAGLKPGAGAGAGAGAAWGAGGGANVLIPL